MKFKIRDNSIIMNIVLSVVFLFPEFRYVIIDMKFEITVHQNVVVWRNIYSVEISNFWPPHFLSLKIASASQKHIINPGSYKKNEQKSILEI